MERLKEGEMRGRGRELDDLFSYEVSRTNVTIAYGASDSTKPSFSVESDQLLSPNSFFHGRMPVALDGSCPYSYLVG